MEALVLRSQLDLDSVADLKSHSRRQVIATFEKMSRRGCSSSVLPVTGRVLFPDLDLDFDLCEEEERDHKGWKRTVVREREVVEVDLLGSCSYSHLWTKRCSERHRDWSHHKDCYRKGWKQKLKIGMRRHSH